LQSQFAGSDPDVFVHLGALDDMDFARYTELKMEWLKHAKLTWLVQGTILKDEVLDILSTVKFSEPEKPIVLKKSHLESFDCPELDAELVAPTTNKATLLYHRLGDFNYADSALLTVLITLIQEQAFA
jgi:secreted Zn-dependent insulinase-like peptidase